VEKVILLSEKCGVDILKILPQFLLLQGLILHLLGLILKSLELILNTGDVEHRLNLLPQSPPSPGPQLHVLPQVPLDNAQGDSLILEFLV